MPRSNVHFDKSNVEKEADVFAACLLVPPDALRKYKDVASIDELASMFAVFRDVVTMLCYRKCPRSGLDFPPFDHTDGLDASGNFICAAGTLFPMAPCGLSSL